MNTTEQNAAALSRSPATAPPRLLIFSDLDETLLDRDTYRWDQAVPALLACRRAGVMVSLVSSKTFAEMEPIQQDLGVSGPMVTENGGGVFFPASGPLPPPEGAREDAGWYRLDLGKPYITLVAALSRIASRLSIPVVGFSMLSAAEVARQTGLSWVNAAMAKIRHFDEPFVVAGSRPPDVAALKAEAARFGLTITRGGRFYHLHGKTDKGKAVSLIQDWYRAHVPDAVFAALGDSENDHAMLRAVDRPFFVGADRNAPKGIDNLTVTLEKGPAGWNEAVCALLDSEAISL